MSLKYYLNGKIASRAQAELWFVSWELECPGRCHSSREACDVFQKALNKEPAALQMIGLSGIGFAPDLALALRALNTSIATGGEYPQALYQISASYGVSHEELQAQYDAQFVT